ncbi:MAG TPA: response regulator transcription factor [Blastococcus sp.]|nr:response regulator transcription factor [Blastococcus sp.]
MTIGVLIVDDQPLVRAGLRKIFEADPAVEVIGEAGDGATAVSAALRLRPQVVVMDIRMPGMDGIEATRRLTRSGGEGIRVLVLTTFDLDEYVFEALRAGASGFLLKDAPPEHLLGAVRTVAAGDALLSPAVTRRVVERFVALPPGRPDLAARAAGLTTREQEVLRRLARASPTRRWPRRW